MNEILGITFGSVIIGGIIIFLGKKLINKVLDAALKTYENKLELLKLEYQNKFELLKIEHQIKFSVMHEERAKILKKLYLKLYELVGSLKKLTTSYQGEEWLTDDKNLKEATEKFNECHNLLQPNRIFFPEEFCKKLEENLNESRLAITSWRQTVTKGKREESFIKNRQPSPYKEGETSMDWWLKTELKVTGEIEENRKKLADEFRKLINV